MSVYRTMEDFVTWVDTSKIRRHVDKYNDKVSLRLHFRMSVIAPSLTTSTCCSAARCVVLLVYCYFTPCRVRPHVRLAESVDHKHMWIAPYRPCTSHLMAHVTSHFRSGLTDGGWLTSSSSLHGACLSAGPRPSFPSSTLDTVS
jgi:hypothetical protein